MGIQRAAVLYPVNTTTVDTGAGIDVRLLDSAEAAATDNGQTVTATHTQDNQQRTFDPATTGVTTNIASTTLGPKGWALRLSEDMTPTDDTNCNAYLPAGTPTVNIRVTINQSGGTYVSGTYAPVWSAALLEYDPVANTGTLICWGTNGGGTSWTIAGLGADLGTFKNISIPCSVGAPPFEFAQGKILLLQIGVGMATIPNPSVGTATWTYTLSVDDASTNLTWAANQGIRQACAISNTLDGRGTLARTLAGALERSAVGNGETSHARASLVSKTFSLDGRGTASHTKALDLSAFSLVGKGEPTMTRAVEAAKSFDLVGVGCGTRALDVGLARSVVGVGEVVTERAVVAGKSFDLVGVGTVTEQHPVQAFRSFDLVGAGTVTGTITIPIDEVPTEGGGQTIKKSPVYLFPEED